MYVGFFYNTTGKCFNINELYRINEQIRFMYENSKMAFLSHRFRDLS